MDISKNIFEFTEYEEYYVLKFQQNSRYISCAPFNGGFGHAFRYINRHVHKDYNNDPEIEIEEFLHLNNIDLEGTVVNLTAADINKFVTSHREWMGYELNVILTAHAGNAISIGNTGERNQGTVNIALITDAPLDNTGMINAFQTIVEAKAQLFNDLKIKDMKTNKISPGTSTDTVSIFVLNDDEKIRYTGRATEIGMAISEMVYESLQKRLG